MVAALLAAVITVLPRPQVTYMDINTGLRFDPPGVSLTDDAK